MVRTTTQTNQTETLDQLVRRLDYGMGQQLFRDAQAYPQRYVAKLVQLYAAQKARRRA